MHVPNTTALIFAMGYQGGTVHQVAGSLGVDVSDILNADADRMGDLLRMAQAYQNSKRSELVPGLMHCAKCQFQLSRYSLNYPRGDIGPGTSETEPCPNGCGNLWPVTYAQRCADLNKMIDDLAAEKEKILINKTVGTLAPSADEVSIAYNYLEEKRRNGHELCMSVNDLRNVAVRKVFDYVFSMVRP